MGVNSLVWTLGHSINRLLRLRFATFAFYMAAFSVTEFVHAPYARWPTEVFTSILLMLLKS
jgi:hypothetical protein